MLQINIVFFFNYLSTPPLSQFVLSLAQAALNSVRTLTLTRSRPISVLYLLSKRSLPEDIIKSNEGTSLTIC